MKSMLPSLAVLGAVAVGACGSDSDSSNGFPQPANTVAINFSIDDTAYPTYSDGQLQWKGSFSYDAATRMLTYGTAWCHADNNGIPCPALYDDGPWTEGGHEPKGAVKGDHKFGVTVFMTVPTAAVTLSYGAINESDGWVWVNPTPGGGNGSLEVPANSTAELTATGMAIPAAGTIDFRLTLDDAALFSGFNFTAGDVVKLKGTVTAWAEVATTTSGHLHQFLLSDVVGPGKALPHSSLLKSGTTVAWTFVVGGVEYKQAGNASPAGVTAEYKPSGGAWTAATIINVDNGYGALNTAVAIP